jgi:hypothetical protein
MTVVALDTLEMAKELKAAGFSDQQAEAVTRLVHRAHDVDLSNVATKAELKAELAETKAEIIKWMFGTIGFQTLIILGAVIALARLLQP